MRAQKRRAFQPTPTELRAYRLEDDGLRFYTSADGDVPQQLMGREIRNPNGNVAIEQINEDIFKGQLCVLFGSCGRRSLVIHDDVRALLEAYIGTRLLEARLVDHEGQKAILPTKEEMQVKAKPRDDRLLGVPRDPPFMFASRGHADA